MRFEDELKFEHISIEDGLSQSVVNCILQDWQGFMWFGTQDGLNRYDGYKFTVYKNDRDSSNSIGNNYINCLFEDKAQNLWIGTQNGLSKYNREKDYFENYYLMTGDPLQLIVVDIRVIYENSYEELLTGTYGEGLAIFDKSKEIFSSYGINKSYLNSNRITSICEDVNNNLWIGTWGDGLYMYDSSSQEYIHHTIAKGKSNIISDNRINSIHEYPKGKLLIGTNNGIYILNIETKEFIHYKNNPFDTDSLSNDLVSKLFEDSKNNIWIGTIEGGLNLFNWRTSKFLSYKYEKKNPRSISNNSITSIYEDRSGILWLGTEGGGLNKLIKSSNKIQHIYSDETDENSLCSNKIYCFCEDTFENLWIGTWDNGLCKYQRKGHKFTHFKHNPNDLNSLSHNKITSIVEDHSKNLWIGTSGHGLDKLDISKNEITHYKKSDNNNSISNNTIFSLSKVKNGIIWIGTGGGGLNKFDINSELFTTYVNDPNNQFSLSSNRIRTIFIDNEDIIWIGTDNGGLNKFDKSEEKFYSYKHDPNDASGISDNNVLTIFEDSSGNLWIGTMNNGLNKFNKKNNTFKRFREKDGLANDSVNGILEDRNGNLWISTSNGLSKFNLKTETFRNYDGKDGFQSNEFNPSACIKLRSGDFVFGGINGFNIFKPEEIKDNPHIPPVVISDFQIFNKPVSLYTKDSPLKKSVLVEDMINLTYYDSVFTFEFAALDYHTPEKNKYAYVMEGFDKDWVYSENRRFATYTNLNPGEYLFRIKGSNNDGVWNEEGRSIKIFITPPFWKTRWFRALSITLGIGAVASVYRNKLNQIQKEKNAQIKFTKKLIEVQENDRKRIASELHDSIGHDLMITQNKLLLSMKNPGNNEFHLRNINEVAGIISTTLKEVREISYNLHPYQIERLGLSKAIISIINRTNNSSNMKFISNVDNIDNLLPPGEEISLYRVIQECITNIMKHSEATEVVFNINKAHNNISILISDNGKGFSLEKVKANSHKHGFGLSGISERLKLIKGKVNIDSSVNHGTKVYIEIPNKIL